MQVETHSELAEEPHTNQWQSGSSDFSSVSLALATLLHHYLQNDHQQPQSTRQHNTSQHTSDASGELHRYKYTEKSPFECVGIQSFNFWSHHSQEQQQTRRFHLQPEATAI